MIQQKKMRFSVLFLAGTAVFLMGYSLWMPKAMIETAKKALSVCAESILPSLALFSVCAKMLLKSGAVRLLCEMHLPFRAEVVTAFLIGLVSGFPTGAATLSALTEKGLLSRKDAEKLLPFCNLAGPSFTLGTVGILFFGMLFWGESCFSLNFLRLFSEFAFLRIFFLRQRRENMRKCLLRFLFSLR